MVQIGAYALHADHSKFNYCHLWTGLGKAFLKIFGEGLAVYVCLECSCCQTLMNQAAN